MVTCQDTDYKRGLIASERRPILPKAGTHLPDQGQAGRLAHLQGLKNLRHHMGGGDEIDVVASLFLQSDHHGGQLIQKNDLAIPQDTDVMVLAEHALEAAMGKENGAGPILPHQGRFFSEMWGETRHFCLTACTAVTRFIPGPVHAALPGAQGAGGQYGKGLLNGLFQPAAPAGFQVTGHISVHGHPLLSPGQRVTAVPR